MDSEGWAVPAKLPRKVTFATWGLPLTVTLTLPLAPPMLAKAFKALVMLLARALAVDEYVMGLVVCPLKVRTNVPLLTAAGKAICCTPLLEKPLPAMARGTT